MHAFLVAVIFAVYFGAMSAWLGYAALQVRHRDEPGRDDTRLDEPAAEPCQDLDDVLAVAV
jgi:hypothetical protein